MDVKKLVHWNWFNKEEDDAETGAPAKRRMLDPLDQFHREIDRMFDRAFGQEFSTGIKSKKGLMSDILKPSLDLSSTDKQYLVTVEIPGVDEKDIKLEIVKDALVISGEKKQEDETRNDSFYRMERSYGSFQRVLTLPDDADRDKVTAEFKKGVLTVTIPRTDQPKQEAQKIDIKAS